MIWELPTTLTVGGVEHPINSDFRDILTILEAYDDPDLGPQERIYVCLKILYADFDDLDQSEYEEAYKQAHWFLDCGQDASSPRKPPTKTVDWEQDAPLIFPAVNKSAGFEVRSVEYLHWWTFMGYFMEIQKSTYSTILSLRNKKAKGEKLEKEERKFWNQNKDLCVIKPKLTTEEKEEKERLLAMLDNL